MKKSIVTLLIIIIPALIFAQETTYDRFLTKLGRPYEAGQTHLNK